VFSCQEKKNEYLHQSEEFQRLEGDHSSSHAPGGNPYGGKAGPASQQKQELLPVAAEAGVRPGLLVFGEASAFAGQSFLSHPLAGPAITLAPAQIQIEARFKDVPVL
jgi:hypothetical protein